MLIYLRSLLFYAGYFVATVLTSITCMIIFWFIPLKKWFIVYSLWCRFVLLWDPQKNERKKKKKRTKKNKRKIKEKIGKERAKMRIKERGERVFDV